MNAFVAIAALYVGLYLFSRLWFRVVDWFIGFCIGVAAEATELTPQREAPAPAPLVFEPRKPAVYIAPVVGMPSVEEPWATSGKAYRPDGREWRQ